MRKEDVKRGYLISRHFIRIIYPFHRNFDPNSQALLSYPQHSTRMPGAERARIHPGPPPGARLTRARNGLGSVDPTNKDCLPLTPPCAATQSSARCSTPRKVKLQYIGWGVDNVFTPRCRPARVQGQRPIRIQLRCAGNVTVPAWILT